MRSALALVLVVAAAPLVVGCSGAPETGRETAKTDDYGGRGHPDTWEIPRSYYKTDEAWEKAKRQRAQEIASRM